MGQVLYGRPEFIKALAQDCRTDLEEVVCAGTTPAHARAAEACLELLACAFDHTTADGPVVLSHFQIVHAVLILPEIASFAAKQFGCVRFFAGCLFQLIGDAVGMALIKGCFATAEPTLKGLLAIAFVGVGGTDQMLFGMVPVHQLLTVAKV